MKIDVIRKMLVLAGVFSLTVFSYTHSLKAQDKGSDKENKVDRDYVLTPMGWTHKSCGREVPDDSVVSREADGALSITDKDGKSIDRIEKCAYEPKFRRIKDGKFDVSAVADTEKPEINGWLEYSHFYAPTNLWGFDWFNQIDGAFYVPSNPTTDGATIFFFNSLEPASGTSIIQPVLQYGTAANGGGNYWAIASWYVTSGGSFAVSPMRTVAVGDIILGSTRGYGCGWSGDCSWSITTSNLLRTTTLNTAAGTDIYDWAQPAVLEAYGVSTCANLPASGRMDFSFTGVYQPGPLPDSRYNMATTVPWNTTITSGTPQCGYRVTNFLAGTTLEF